MSDPLAAWLTTNAPALVKSLAAPADAADIAAALAPLGRELPKSYLDFLREHDGQRWIEGEAKGVGSLAPIFTAFEILGVRHAAGEWRAMQEWGHAKPTWWPITTIGGESRHHCIDDQNRIVIASMKDPDHVVVAESFEAFITRLTAILDSAEVTTDGIDLNDDALDWLWGSS